MHDHLLHSENKELHSHGGYGQCVEQESFYIKRKYKVDTNTDLTHFLNIKSKFALGVNMLMLFEAAAL